MHLLHAEPISPVVMVGLPFDAHSSFRRGARLAPKRIRESFYNPDTNRCTELGLDLATAAWRDVGDADLPDRPGAEAMDAITETVAGLLAQNGRVLALGGDHSITYPILRAYAQHFAPLTVLHLDAHPDLYDDFEGNPYSHASPFARIMEAGLATRLVQVGIRTMNPHQRAQAKRFGVDVIEMRDFSAQRLPVCDGPFYLSLDLDCLDPAFAPGVSHHEPGGLSVREVLHLIQNVSGTLVGADLVELNPDRDWMGMTARVAAKFAKELLGRMVSEATAA